jgi:CubicO group peptidase (beta-lactamase class C family)
MAVYGKSFTEVLQEKLCEPLGTEYPGYIMVAADGDEPTCGGVVNFTARDYAKLGELYRLGGKLRGKQIVPAGYVKASVTVSAPQFAPSMPIMGNKRFAPGYGYLWWIPEPGKDFTALGVYNQFVYCNPGDGTVIVKLSANPRYGISTLDSDSKDAENISALQAISASLVR